MPDPVTPPPTNTKTTKREYEEGAIKVRRLSFDGPREVPGNSATARGVTSGEAARGTYEVTYLPRLRHHRVTFRPRDSDKRPLTKMFHETVCEWEPLEP